MLDQFADMLGTRDLVREFYGQIWNAGDTDGIKRLLTEDFSFRGSLGPKMRGREAFYGYVNTVRTALDEYRCDILDCIVEGPRAFARMRFSGRHVGTFRGFAPTGKQVEWLGAALFETREGRIAELWVLGDLLTLESDLAADREATGA